MYGEKAWRQLHKNVASNIKQVLEADPTKQQLYGHLPPITKTIQVRRTRHAGHCWRSRDELTSDILLWTPSHGQAKVGRERWTIEKGGGRGSGRSTLVARHDDDDIVKILRMFKVYFVCERERERERERLLSRRMQVD